MSRSKIQTLSVSIQPTPKQKSAIIKFKEKLDSGEYAIENQNYDNFTTDILVNALGYPRNEIKEQYKNTDRSWFPATGDHGILFELKSRKKKVFSDQGYDKPEQKTPVDQAVNYVENHSEFAYAVATNFEEFVLLTRNNFKEKCYKFTFPPKGQKLTDEEITDFFSVFSKKSIELRHPDRIVHETIIQQNKLSDDFYQIYHQTRLMLIQAFKEKNILDQDNAIKITQTYLNRLIFLFFAEDTGLVKDNVFSSGILSLLNSGDIKQGTTKISDHIQTIFSWMNEGSHEIDHKLGFNGEFFKDLIDRNAFFHDFVKFEDITNKTKLPKNVKLNEEYQKSVDRYNGQINPIIINLLIMDSYNFGKESTTGKYVSVNILGHIFEQSIGDLEKLHKKEKLHNKETSQRKKDGVYYTPDYITTYICKNTIIPYLSKKNSTEPYQLVSEYVDDISQLEKKLEQIKILDPACGSGAFLVKAVDVLISIYDEIQTFKESRGAYIVIKKGKQSSPAQVKTFDKGIEMEQMRGIIQNNIYGVDINPESVEITKLSLFLKIASKNKRLIGLKERIKVGNSLIDDKNIDPKAFDWKTNFAEIMDDNIANKGFDIVIGNPPYLKIEHIDEKSRHYFQEYYPNSYMKRFDAYGLFVDKSISLLKNGGFFGMIMPSTMLSNITFSNLRKLILDSTTIQQIVNLGGKIFQNVNNDTLILIFTNNVMSNFETEIYEVPKYGGGFTTTIKTHKSDFRKIAKSPNYSFELRTTQNISNIFAKMENNTMPLSEICSVFQGLITGNNDAYIVTDNEIKQENLERKICKPCAFGDDVKRYGHTQPKNHVIYLSRNDDISDYPQVKHRLEPYKSILEKKHEVLGRQPWYALHRARNSENFERKEKLFVQAIRNLSLKRRIVATIDSDRLYADHTVFVPILEDNNYNLKYILGILNSKTINYFFQIKFIDINIKGVYLDTIPIPKLSINEQKPFVEKVEQILAINENISALSKKLIDKISQNFQIEKFSNKLLNFYESDFKQFFDELKKQKIKLTLSEQDGWEEYFENKKNKILENINDLNKIESELDELIYQTYNLTESEIKIIENEIL